MAPMNSPAARASRPARYYVNGHFAPPTASPAYTVGLCAAAAAMVVLPLIYLALVTLVGWLVFLHAVRDFGILAMDGDIRARIIFYFGPLVVGLCILFVLLKPLLWRSEESEGYVVLARADAPELFNFIDQLVAAIGAPAPREIRVDCEANASASFRRGFRSLAGDDLVLTLGLPLVRALDLRQFAGVVAHEFGHFTQGGGMRLAYVVRSINGWFARVVFQRDSLDATLQQVTSSGRGQNLIIILLAAITRAGVWASRQVLRLLMMAGHAISSFLLRQMEFDADRCAARLAGSAAFESALLEIPRTAVAAQGARIDLRQGWENRRLVDDLPGLVSANRRQLSAEDLARLGEAELKARTALFDTHPATRDRLESVRREAAPGLVTRHDEPAALFTDFAGLCRAATARHYTIDLGLDVAAIPLVPCGEFVAGVGREYEAMSIFRRYLDPAWLQAWRPYPAAAAPPPGGEASAAALGAAREELLRARATVGEMPALASTALDRRLKAMKAHELLELKVAIDVESFKLPAASVAGAERALDRADEQRRQSRAGLAPLEASWQACLAVAEARLADPDAVAAWPPDAPFSAAAFLAALEAARRMAAHAAERESLENLYMRMVGLTEAIQAGVKEAKNLADPLQRRTFELCSALRAFRATLAGIDFPLMPEGRSGTLADFCFEGHEPEDDPARILGLGRHVLIREEKAFLLLMVRLAEGLEWLAPRPAAAGTGHAPGGGVLVAG